jgi:hypothetical protein
MVAYKILSKAQFTSHIENTLWKWMTITSSPCIVCIYFVLYIRSTILLKEFKVVQFTQPCEFHTFARIQVLCNEIF